MIIEGVIIREGEPIKSDPEYLDKDHFERAGDTAPPKVRRRSNGMPVKLYDWRGNRTCAAHAREVADAAWLADMQALGAHPDNIHDCEIAGAIFIEEANND
jgi:hypothetical protein